MLPSVYADLSDPIVFMSVDVSTSGRVYDTMTSYFDYSGILIMIHETSPLTGEFRGI